MWGAGIDNCLIEEEGGVGMNEASPGSLRELLAQLNSKGVSDYRRYETMRRFLNIKARDKGVPISGSFELTPLCNLDCRMCYVHLQKNQMQGAQLLRVDQWKQIMQQAIDAGMMYARLTGGECLTYPGFRELYLFLRDRGIETVILSNGILMDEKMTEFLKKNPPAAIQISVYGAGEDAYERVTGRRCFEQVTANLRRLRDADIPLVAAVTPNAYMTDGESIIRLLQAEKIPYAINSGIMKPREETGRDLADADLDTYIDMLKLRNSFRGGSLEPETDPDGLPDPNQKRGNTAFGVTCGAGRSGFAVDWRGGMRPCNNFPCDGEDILKLGFREAWNRTNHTATHFPLPAECEGCAYKGVCKHCVAEHAAGAMPGHASPAICAMGKRMVIEGLCSLNNKDE